MKCVISHQPTKIQFPTRQDGGLRDPDARRRARRLGESGIAIEKSGLLRHDVKRGDQHLGSRRTRSGAEMLAFTSLDGSGRRDSHRERVETAAGWHLRTAR